MIYLNLLAIYHDYKQCEFLSPGLLGHESYYTFRTRYAIMKTANFGGRSVQIVVGYRNLDELSEKLKAFIEERVIQIAPLAFMRGRTLDNAFVILDEAQNTTVQQMKMFLTRMGRSAKFVVTGDMTQIDLPNRQKSGLSHSLDLLKDLPEIGMVYLDQKDVIRHKLVMKIIQAYKQEQTIKEK